MSIVLKGLLAIDRLYAIGNPAWFVLLSGSDYPVGPPKKVLADLRNANCDAYLDNRELSYGVLRRGSSQRTAGWKTGCQKFGSSQWLSTAYDRYVARVFRPSGAAGSCIGEIVIRHPLLLTLVRSSHLSGSCFAGDHWFTANRRVANILRRALATHRNVFEYFARRAVPDEAFYQTLLCNHAELTISPNNYRFSAWAQDAIHPRELTHDDIPIIMKSGAHFARKVGTDVSVVDELDRAVDRLL